MLYNKSELISKVISEDANGLRYVVIDNLFDVSFIKKCESEFLLLSESNFIRYSNPLFEFEKYTMNKLELMPKNLGKLFNEIHSDNFVKHISGISGIGPLKIDEEKWGGGLHMTKKGGYLSVHRDFNILPSSYSNGSQMLRCMNLIGYLNSSWKDDDGGELEFWDRSGNNCIESIKPVFNRWVLFDTRENFHGHPYPYLGDSPRLSIASYYYKEETIDESSWSSTQYLKLPWMEDSDDYEKARKERSDYKKRYSSLLNK